jgi:hypothetical protein
MYYYSLNSLVNGQMGSFNVYKHHLGVKQRKEAPLREIDAVCSRVLCILMISLRIFRLF